VRPWGWAIPYNPHPLTPCVLPLARSAPTSRSGTAASPQLSPRWGQRKRLVPEGLALGSGGAGAHLASPVYPGCSPGAQGASCVPGVRVVPSRPPHDPQLHWMVREANLHHILPPPAHPPAAAAEAAPGQQRGPGLKGEEDYCKALVPAFYRCTCAPGREGGHESPQGVTVVDGANGVGGLKLRNDGRH